MKYSSNQKGAALITGLIILIIMTGLALAAVRQTIVQEEMAYSNKDRQTAFQAAEAALREGEMLLAQDATIVANYSSDINAIKSYISGVNTTSTGCVSSLKYLCYRDKVIDYKDDAAWSNTGAVRAKTVTTAFATVGTDVTALPQFIIQHAYTLTASNANAFYVTAKGTALKDGTSVYLQSVFIVSK